MAIEINVSGIPCVFDNSALDDWKVLKLVARMQDNDVAAIVAFAERVFGAEQLENIEGQLADESGVCKASAMTQFVMDAMQAAAAEQNGSAKN